MTLIKHVPRLDQLRFIKITLEYFAVAHKKTNNLFIPFENSFGFCKFENSQSKVTISRKNIYVTVITVLNLCILYVKDVVDKMVSVLGIDNQNEDYSNQTL